MVTFAYGKIYFQLVMHWNLSHFIKHSNTAPRKSNPSSGLVLRSRTDCQRTNKYKWGSSWVSYQCCLCVSCISQAHSTATGPGACNCLSDGTASSSQLLWRQWGVCSRLRHRTTRLPWSCTSCQKNTDWHTERSRAGSGPQHIWPQLHWLQWGLPVTEHDATLGIWIK